MDIDDISFTISSNFPIAPSSQLHILFIFICLLLIVSSQLELPMFT